jgi:hypothetical protein
MEKQKRRSLNETFPVLIDLSIDEKQKTNEK